MRIYCYKWYSTFVRIILHCANNWNVFACYKYRQLRIPLASTNHRSNENKTQKATTSYIYKIVQQRFIQNLQNNLRIQNKDEILQMHILNLSFATQHELNQRNNQHIWKEVPKTEILSKFITTPEAWPQLNHYNGRQSWHTINSNRIYLQGTIQIIDQTMIQCNYPEIIINGLNFEVLKTLLWSPTKNNLATSYRKHSSTHRIISWNYFFEDSINQR